MAVFPVVQYCWYSTCTEWDFFCEIDCGMDATLFSAAQKGVSDRGGTVQYMVLPVWTLSRHCFSWRNNCNLPLSFVQHNIKQLLTVLTSS